MPLFPIPNVIVYPPAEDNSTPFCCFDASQALPYSPTQADLDAQGSALDFISHDMQAITPGFFRKAVDSSGVILPRRRNPVVNFHDEDEQDYFDNDITIRGSSPGNDSEIAEVVKVRRRYDHDEVIPRSTSDSTSKQPKGFKARASRAFSSLRLGRSTTRSRSSDGRRSESSSRAPSPSPMSRRPSVVLSGIFNRSPSPSPSNSQARMSTASFESSADTSSPPASPTISTAFSSIGSALSGEIHTPTSGDMHTFAPYTTDTEDEEEDDTEPQHGDADPQFTPRATQFTNPGSSPSRAGRRRFSVLNLFSSFSSSQPASEKPIATSPSTPVLPIMSRDSLGPSTESCESGSSVASSVGPATPVDEIFPPPDAGRSSGPSLLRRLPSLTRKKEPALRSISQPTPVSSVPPNSKPTELDDINETSFSEMRLDSLHFSELSFDAGKF